MKQNAITFNGQQNIGYAGNVTIKIQHGKKILKSVTYHNSGLMPLFKFLSLCLAGQYSEAMRPCKIKLFYYSDAESSTPVTPNNFDWNNPGQVRNLKAASPFVLYDTTPKVRQKENSVETTFHFRVPFMLVANDTVHAVGFFPNEAISGLETQAAAYYLFTKDNGTAWQPLRLSEVRGNYSIIIEWKMTIMNAPIETEETNQVATTNN